MSSPSSFDPVRPASPRQVLLGFFILFQLAFLVVSNLLGFLKWSNSEASGESARLINRLAPRFAREEGHGWHWCDDLERCVLRRWTQFSLQDEDWSLFAPDVGKTTGFLAVLLLNEDPPGRDQGLMGAIQVFDPINGHHFLADWSLPAAPDTSFSPQAAWTLAAHLQGLAGDSALSCLTWQAVHAAATPAQQVALMMSDNEPADIHKFFRFGQFRLRRYEGIMYFYPLPRSDESAAEHAERLTRRVQRLVRDYRDTVLVYSQWRLRSWQQTHLERPVPKQVILCQRLYRIHGPDETHGWDGPFLIPMARWRPRAGQADADVVLDAYDFTQQRFSPVK